MTRKILSAAALVTILAPACTYEARFGDCAVRCAASAQVCPDDLSCDAAGFCRVPGVAGTCAMNDAMNDAAPTGGPPSCAGLPATCGPNEDEDCCATATTIPGGTFFRSYDVASDVLYPSTAYPATVGAFKLDRFEVTVGRFRAFVAAGGGTQTHPPTSGAGAHAAIPSSGWDESWNAALVTGSDALATDLKCDAVHQTWTDAAGSNEDLPIDCVTWYEAFAFCAWDGGFLPTEAEWNFATAGGEEQRAYPWSDPPGSTLIDCAHANYDINSPNGTYCVGSGRPNTVGNESPKGDGLWGQADLGGNVLEWTLDGDGTYVSPCSNCVNLTNTANKIIRGGSFLYDASFQRSAARKAITAPFRGGDIGVRCARIP